MTYEGNPSQMFSGGNFKNLGQFLSGINNPWTFDANAQKEYQKKLAEEKKIAETKSIAYQGFKGTGEKNGKGNISTPGSVKKDAVSNVQDIGNKIISSATHPEEIITSIVSQMINKALSQGLGNMDKVISKELSSVSGLSSILKTSTSKNGPAAAYKSSSSGVSTSSLMDGH